LPATSMLLPRTALLPLAHEGLSISCHMHSRILTTTAGPKSPSSIKNTILWKWMGAMAICWPTVAPITRVGWWLKRRKGKKTFLYVGGFGITWTVCYEIP